MVSVTRYRFSSVHQLLDFFCCLRSFDETCTANSCVSTVCVPLLFFCGFDSGTVLSLIIVARITSAKRTSFSYWVLFSVKYTMSCTYVPAMFCWRAASPFGSRRVGRPAVSVRRCTPRSTRRAAAATLVASSGTQTSASRSTFAAARQTARCPPPQTCTRAGTRC